MVLDQLTTIQYCDYIASDSMVKLKGYGRKWSRPTPNNIAGFSWRGWGEWRRNSVRIAGVPAEIWTEHISHTSLKQPISWFKIPMLWFKHTWLCNSGYYAGNPRLNLRLPIGSGFSWFPSRWPCLFLSYFFSLNFSSPFSVCFFIPFFFPSSFLPLILYAQLFILSTIRLCFQSPFH